MIIYATLKINWSTNHLEKQAASYEFILALIYIAIDIWFAQINGSWANQGFRELKGREEVIEMDGVT